jgi:CDP-diglyceride synthetase
MFNLESWELVTILIGVVVGIPVLTVLFRAGCSLADVLEPNFAASLAWVTLTLAVGLPLGWLLFRVLGARDADPDGLLGPMHVLGMILGLLLSLSISGVAYKFILRTSYGKGQLIAGFELLLGALLTTLVAAIVLVVLAGVQIVNRPAARAAAPAALTHPADSVSP